jgi:hypothetical protein
MINEVTNYICRSCCAALTNKETFLEHAMKHGIDMTQQFQRKVVSSSRWPGWHQEITKITTKEGFEFFETVSRDVTMKQFELVLS